MKLPRHAAKRGRVEIIPLIDTVLILLIFYMSFSSFRGDEHQLAAPLPNNIGNVPALEVQVDVRGAEMLVNGAAYDAPTLHALLVAVRQGDERVGVVIGATPDTDYQSVIRVLDLCAQANVRKVSFRPLNG